jgi:hypothetical protein
MQAIQHPNVMLGLSISEFWGPTWGAVEVPFTLWVYMGILLYCSYGNKPHKLGYGAPATTVI